MRAEPAADAVFEAAVWKVYVREGVLVEAGDWWTSAGGMDEDEARAGGLDWRVLRDDGVGGEGCAGRCRKICWGFVKLCWARRSFTGTCVRGCCIQRSIWGGYGGERVVDMVVGGPGGARCQPQASHCIGHALQPCWVIYYQGLRIREMWIYRCDFVMSEYATSLDSGSRA